MDIRKRFRGCLLGLAVGDALGTTLEFRQLAFFLVAETMDRKQLGMIQPGGELRGVIMGIIGAEVEQ
jgi:hypothetical protein